MRDADLPYQNERRRDGIEQDALLTESHRDFLEGDGSGYNKSQSSKYKTDISNRLFNSFLDMALISRNSDRLTVGEDVFEPETFKRKDADEDSRSYQRQVTQPTEALEELIALVYRETKNRSHPLDFETILKKGIRRAEGSHGEPDPYIQVELEIDQPFGAFPVRHVQEKIIDGEWREMEDGELRLLARCLADMDEGTREAIAHELSLEAAIERIKEDAG